MKFLVFILTLFISIAGYAQLHQHEVHEGHGHYHLESNIGIGGAAAIVYIPNEKHFAPGIHIHALKLFNEHLGAGIGYEAIY